MEAFANFLLFCSAFFQISSGALENGAVYLIGNSLISFLKVEDSGVMCESVATVIHSQTLDVESDSYRWLYRKPSSDENAYLEIDTEDANILLNEVTISNRSSGTGPGCLWNERKMNITLVTQALYQIRSNEEDDGCLLTNGLGNRISWGKCNESSYDQLFIFLRVV
ncbi:hypothetical protein Ocin01_07589 [Orchesella cincta]|uniref:Uncharacterized protein n=1 Tax=Orchesella cincta TaxID=48709 RepID=A0A1D2N1H9_ORCCI|nr:hypothetical protein Ocin01_07589 [Orchesella cincta]